RNYIYVFLNDYFVCKEVLVLKTEFEFIVNNYKEFYDNQKTKHNRVLDKEMKEVITQRLPQKIQKKLDLDENIYYVTGSFGMGNYTETPWISIFEKDITVGAQKGFYIVFLFRKDMTGFYLSLNQGVTYLEEKFKGNKPKNKIREVVEKLRNEITLPTDVFPNLDTETPWISIFEKDITVGAQKGFYIVFLFRKDMTGFYLSLNQGVTYLEEKFKGNKPKNKIREVVEKLRNEITLPTDVFPNLDI